MIVSVIIPTYNCERYIVEAIESVLNQTYRDIEIIVIDDGSTDNTKEVLRPYLGRIRYIYQNRQGLSRARNIGIREARGKYIAFLDADDRWKPFKLALQVWMLENLLDVDMVFSNYAVIDESGNFIEDFYLEKGFSVFQEYKLKIKDMFSKNILLKNFFIDNTSSDVQVFYGDVFDKLFMGNFILPSTELIRKSSLDSSLLFNEEYKCATDQDFHLRFARKHSIAYLDCSTTEYRINRENQLSSKKNTHQLILNTINTRLSIINSDREFNDREKKLIRNVLSMNYYRLAYYHLSEFNRTNARHYAAFSLRYRKFFFKSWIVFLLSFLPSFMLLKMRSFKSFIKRLF